MVQRLLQVRGIGAGDVRAQDNHALRWASARGHHAVVGLLLQVPGIGAADVRAMGVDVRDVYAAVVDRLLQVPGINANDVRAAQDDPAAAGARHQRQRRARSGP